jgi:hypothetical protein
MDKLDFFRDSRYVSYDPIYLTYCIACKNKMEAMEKAAGV